MAPASATARIVLAACFFFLPLSFLSYSLRKLEPIRDHLGPRETPCAPSKLYRREYHVAAVVAPPLSFSFDFSNTSSYRIQDLLFQGDVALSDKDKLVDLITCKPTSTNCSGRMSYNHPVPLYDIITGELASFVTTFTFAINLLPNTTTKGDGMTFFLSGYPSILPPGSVGPLLGLTNSSQGSASGDNRFLAVEFDMYDNSWDPMGSTDHIGINVNSIASVMTKSLPSYSLNGTMTATITFDNTTKTLEATLHFANRSRAPESVKTKLLGRIDALLPPEVAVGFSATTGGYFEYNRIHSWSFNSTIAAREGGNKVHLEKGQALVKKGLIIGGAVTLVLALVLVIWSILSWCSWKRTRDSFGTGSRLKRFNYHDLSIATNGFSNTNKIGAGGFGVVYSGTLGTEQVAVKRILKDSRGEFKDFLAELSAIGRTGHANVVRLEGWCCSISNFMSWYWHRQNVKLFLVYELVPNGDLHRHLHEGTEVLSWERRYKIVKGLLSALHYLHHECSPYILHRDIKPSNILLDNEFNAKLGDFGLSRVAQDSRETSLQTGMAVGTVDYMDPMCKKDGQVKLRPSSDVYSFGIVLLEIAHGENDPYLVRKLHVDRPETFVRDVADKKLAGQFDEMEMERVIVLGLQCSERDENQRPSLTSAIFQFLENGGELPPAPANKPHTVLPLPPSVLEKKIFKFFSKSNNVKFDQVYRKTYQRLNTMYV